MPFEDAPPSQDTLLHGSSLCYELVRCSRSIGPLWPSLDHLNLQCDLVSPDLQSFARRLPLDQFPRKFHQCLCKGNRLRKWPNLPGLFRLSQAATNPFRNSLAYTYLRSSRIRSPRAFLKLNIAWWCLLPCQAQTIGRCPRSWKARPQPRGLKCSNCSVLYLRILWSRKANPRTVTSRWKPLSWSDYRLSTPQSDLSILSSNPPGIDLDFSDNFWQFDCPKDAKKC